MGMKNHMQLGHLTKMAIFANSRWRTAAILKIALSLYLSRELSYFDQIWYTDTNFHYEHAHLTKNRNFQIQDGGRTPYWKSFLAIYRRLIGRLTRNSELEWQIMCRYRSRDKYGIFHKFMYADGRYYENSFRCLRHSVNELMLSTVFWICASLDI